MKPFSTLVNSVAIAVFSLMTSAAFAQSVNVTSGSINGRVVDPTGAVLPGATVTVRSQETGLRRDVATDPDGTYSVPLLPPGKYSVRAELVGLGKAVMTDVEVLLGNSTKVDIKISPEIAETVTVKTSTPVVDTTRTGTAVSITNDQIENLPIIGRDFRSLAALTPGIADAFGGRITSNGSRGIGTDYNIDGATSNNDFFGENTGGTRAPFTFSQAAIREFQVIRSQYSAEFGRGVGAQLNAITKSGTNDLSGEMFFFRRNRSWAAKRELTFSNGQTVVDSFRAKDSTQPGFAVGGPIVRDRLFFFGNVDAQRQQLPVTSTDIRTRNEFLALSSTTQQQFLSKLENYLGHPYDDELNYNQTFNQNTYLGKVDMNAGSRLRVSIRDNFTNFENANNQSANQRSNQGTEHDKFNQLVGQATMVINKRLFNDLLVQHTRDERPVDPAFVGTEFSVSGISSSSIFFGQNDFLPNNTREKKVQVKDTVQYLAGKHTFRAGAELLFMNIDNLFPRNLGGVYTYNTAQAFVDDTPNSFKMGYGPGGGLTSWKQNTYGFYASDSFRAGKRLSLDVGVRYDWQTMPLPAANAFPQHPEFITNIREDKNNVAPRLGFAYDLTANGRSVVRGGVGKFFGYMPDILLSNPLTQISGNFTQLTAITCATATIVKCPTFPNVLTPDQFNTLAKISTDIVSISPGYQAQQAVRSSLQFEQQIGKSYTAAIGVIRSRLSKVQGTANINAVKTGVMLGNLPLWDLVSANRRYTDMGVVRELCSCETASYDAVTLETHKLGMGRSMFSWDLSYTWAKTIDQDTNERSTSTSFLYDPTNPALSEGPSDNDVRHRVVGDATVRAPFGIMLSTIVQWRTGVPYTAGISFTGTGIPGTPSSLSGLSQTSGNIPTFVNSSGTVIDMTLANNFSRQQLVDFLNQQGATIVGRNTYRQPNWYNIDLRLTKTFAFEHNTKVQFIAEAFNILNTKNRLVSSGNTVIYKGGYTQSTDKYTFSKVTSFGLTSSYASYPDPRQYQGAIKFIF